MYEKFIGGRTMFYYSNAWHKLPRYMDISSKKPP